MQDTSPGVDPATYMTLLKDETNFSAIMLLVMFREMSLTELTRTMNKSKPTVHRHVHALIEAGLVIESREEIVRGNIPAKYYTLSPDAFSKFPHVDKTTLDAMTTTQKVEVYRHIKNILVSSMTFASKSIQRFTGFIESMDEDGAITRLMDPVPMSFNINFLTETQYARWIEILTSATMKFVEVLKETEMSEPDAKRPYFFLHACLPLMDTFLDGKASDESNEPPA